MSILSGIKDAVDDFDMEGFSVLAGHIGPAMLMANPDTAALGQGIAGGLGALRQRRKASEAKKSFEGLLSGGFVQDAPRGQKPAGAGQGIIAGTPGYNPEAPSPYGLNSAQRNLLLAMGPEKGMALLSKYAMPTPTDLMKNAGALGRMGGDKRGAMEAHLGLRPKMGTLGEAERMISALPGAQQGRARQVATGLAPNADAVMQEQGRMVRHEAPSGNAQLSAQVDEAKLDQTARHFAENMGYKYDALSQAMKQFLQSFALDKMNAESSRMRANAALQGKLGTRVSVGGATVSAEQETEYQKARGKSWAGEMERLTQEGAAAREQSARLGALSGILSDPGVYQGAGGGWLAKGKSALEALGIDTNGLSETQTAQALLNSYVLDELSKLKGPATDKDLAFVERAAPMLTRTREGNRAIIALSKAAADGRTKLANAAARYERQNGRLDYGFDVIRDQIQEDTAEQMAGIVMEVEGGMSQPVQGGAPEGSAVGWEKYFE